MPGSFMRNNVSALAMMILTTVLFCFMAEPVQAGSSKIAARYNIAFNGLSIGTFHFRSTWTSGEYRLRAGARISLLSGIIFDWRAQTESSGRLTSRGPLPTRYRFGYESSDKSGSVTLRFTGTSISSVNVDPPPGSNRVPVKQHHMRGVLDPLSAVIGLSQLRRPDRGRQSCNDKLRIFDGKMRYDLVLRYKTTQQVRSAGYSGAAYVCRVQFKPIAGHKADKEETRFFENTDGIEVWLVPVRKAGLFVPYRIYLPLPIGSATMTTEEFRLESAKYGRLMVIGAS